MEKITKNQTKTLAQSIKRNVCKDSAITGNPAIDPLDLVELKARRDLGENVRTRKAYEQRVRALTFIQELAVTRKLKADRKKFLDAKKFLRRETRGFIAESHEIGDMDMGGAANTQSYQNVTEHAGEVPVSTKIGDSLHSTPDGGKTQFSLDSFFQRPVSIYDAVWDSGTEYNVILKPWNLWVNNPTIRAKLSNYSYFKGTLNIKISTTGTPYHYGRIQIPYFPYARYNDNLIGYDQLLAATTPSTVNVLPSYKCYASQAPGVVYLDVKENEPVILQIPFISHKSKWRLFNDNNSVITNATEFADFEEAGELRLITLNSLAVANADYDSSVSMNIYAWMTDVELGCVTATDMNITAESKDIDANWQKSKEGKPMYDQSKSMGQRIMGSLASGGDEYSEPGPVQNVATAIGKVGDSLASIPVIGGFARATATVAKSLGKVASWFGWSRPAILTDAIFVKNNPFTNGASTIGKDTTYRITLDPKQELSVDLSLAGTDSKDDMTIAAIASRESFLTTFTWADTDVAMTTNLWRCVVSPYLYQTMPGYTEMLNHFVQPTSLFYAAQPFNAWRGTIKYRFEIVCSKFHRGKILFKYDPNFAQASLISSNTTTLNQQNTIIVDIQDAQDVCFTVDWANQRNWAGMPSMIGSNFGAPLCDLENGQAAYFPGALMEQTNGFIEVRPINELVQPTSTSPVSINVYVSCDDLTVNRVSEDHLPTSRQIYTVESRDIVTESINPTGAKIDEKIFLDHYGEKIISFRSLLKRFTTAAVVDSVSTITGIGYTQIRATLYPPATNTLTGKRGDVFVSQTLYNYLRFAYMGIRGGMRYRIAEYTDQSTKTSAYQKISMLPDAEPSRVVWTADTYPIEDLTDLQINDTNNLTSNLSGSVVYHQASNGGIEAELPFYSKSLFMFSFADRLGLGNYAEEGAGFDAVFNTDWSAYFSHQSTATDNTVFVIDSCPAEDFTFLRYQGAPFFSAESRDLSKSPSLLPEAISPTISSVASPPSLTVLSTDYLNLPLPIHKRTPIFKKSISRPYNQEYKD